MSDPKPPSNQELDTDIMPLSIERDNEAGIAITWSDQRVTRWSASALRKMCPCATCREKKRGDQEKAQQQQAKGSNKPLGLPVLSAAETRPLRIEAMRPVGSYAYNIAFSDGHNSGIFPFAMLYQGAS